MFAEGVPRGRERAKCSALLQTCFGVPTQSRSFLWDCPPSTIPPEDSCPGSHTCLVNSSSCPQVLAPGVDKVLNPGQLDGPYLEQAQDSETQQLLGTYVVRSQRVEAVLGHEWPPVGRRSQSSERRPSCTERGNDKEPCDPIEGQMESDDAASREAACLSCILSFFGYLPDCLLGPYNKPPFPGGFLFLATKWS